MTGNVHESDSGYRRGLVLGLTLAEIGTLIIFVLLLLIGFEQLRLQKFEDKVAVPHQEWERVENERARLSEIMKAAGMPENAASEDFTRLVRDLAAVSAGNDFSEALRTVQDEVKSLRAAQKQLASMLADLDVERPEEVAEQLSAQAQTIADLESQKSKLVEQLGNGLVYPSCWYDEQGEIQYVYRVDLASEGMRIMDVEHPSRKDDRARLPFPPASPKEYLSPAQFLAATSPLFEWSVANECRFVVIVHDTTAPNEKPLYKSLMQTLERNFYKLQSDEPPPF